MTPAHTIEMKAGNEVEAKDKANAKIRAVHQKAKRNMMKMKVIAVQKRVLVVMRT